MKVKVTKKFVNKNFKHVLKIGYCQIPHLLHAQVPHWYIVGVNGWNADIYQVDGVAICTGYRPFGNIEVSYDLIKSYDEMAKDILSEDTDFKLDRLQCLLSTFIKEAIKEAKK